MAPTRVVAYPPPPPTSNSLTSQEKSQLLRRARKLGQVLGSTPLIDSSSLVVPRHVDLPLKRKESKSKNHYYDELPKSVTNVHLARADSTSSISSRSSVDSTDSASSSHIGHIQVKELSSTRPLLQLARPMLEPIPGSPSPSTARFTISPHPATSRPDSITAAPPSFTIPSDASMRRAKMDRLRRKLGDGVPVDLVFRNDTELASRSATLPSRQSTPSKAQKYPPPIQISVSSTTSTSTSPRRTSQRNTLRAINEVPGSSEWYDDFTPAPSTAPSQVVKKKGIVETTILRRIF